MGDHGIICASAIVRAPAQKVFELIADPSKHPEWDGNDNLRYSDIDQRVTAVGDVFITELTNGGIRENHVVEFIEGQRVAWKPSEVSTPPPGHLWRWELLGIDDSCTEVTHTYDWTALHNDVKRQERARSTNSEMLEQSILKLKELAEKV